MEKPALPKWLEELQQKSWEPEILLSGIVLYGMFQAPDLLDNLLKFAQVNISESNDFDNLISIMKVATYWLTFGLILHLISRGIWVGMVGLSFTFPNGINHERLNHKGKFDNHIRKIPPMEKIIIRLEKVCSSLFSISFMLFMSLIGTYFFFAVLIVAPILSYLFLIVKGDFSDLESQIWSTYAIVVLVIGLIGMIDFLTLGFLKRFKWLSKIYWPFYLVVSTLTLSRFYRPIYYTIVSNFGKWKISIFLVFFVVTSIFGHNISSGSDYPGDGFSRISLWSNNTVTGAYTGYYDDQMGDIYSVRAHIQSDIIQENVVRLFVVLRADLEDSIKSHCNYDSLLETENSRARIDLACLGEFYHIKLGDSLLADLTWRFQFKQSTNQRGILTYIDITDLDRGNYELEIGGPPDMYSRHFALIPFYREINLIPSNKEKSPSTEEEKVNYLRLKPLLPK